MWLFIADRNAAYADRVEARLIKRADSLARIPGQGRRVSGSDARRVSIPDVQCVISYRIEENAVRILSVRSTRHQLEQP